jgi:hypothetical protein
MKRRDFLDHGLAPGGAFQDAARGREFRDDLAAPQLRLRRYASALAEMASVEELTTLDKP